MFLQNKAMKPLILMLLQILSFNVMLLCAYLTKQPLWHCTAAFYAVIQRTVLTLPVLDYCVLFYS